MVPSHDTLHGRLVCRDLSEDEQQHLRNLMVLGDPQDQTDDPLKHPQLPDIL